MIGFRETVAMLPSLQSIFVHLNDTIAITLDVIKVTTKMEQNLKYES